MGQSSYSERMLHRVNLDAVGGVEVSFLQYAEFRQALGIADTVVPGDSVHPRFGDALAAPLQTLWREQFKHWHGVRLPRAFRGLRARWAAHCIRPYAPSVILAWNHIGSRQVADIANAARLPLIHYEHGEAWREQARHAGAFFDQVDGAIVNSFAAERMLALRWGWQGPVERVYYSCDGVRAIDAARGAPPSDRPIRIGAAARMIELKGHRIALHTVKVLRDEHGLDVTLAIAGTGAEESALHAESKRLGLTDIVDFKGSVPDMAAFYDEIDLMLVPSMVEPFGRTSMEAQARGCPLIVTAVDGLPETLEPGNTAAQVVPDWSLDEYKKELGGNVESVLPWAYDPVSDQLIQPRAVSPARLATAIRELVTDENAYRDASLSGLRNANKRFLPELYGPAVDAAVASLVRVGKQRT
ncbi:group 1 glycosyl transferase [Salinisphaera sp. C84B14]|uniref:glycosyltransferase family 4 protein n=1 Tax=Salinisphaera sp. C84B14 TaxID=1304155 RepID=UPI0033406E87